MSSVLLFTPIFHYYGVIEIRNQLGNITGYQCDKLPGTIAECRTFFITMLVIAILYIIITVAIVNHVKRMRLLKAKPVHSDVTVLSDLSKHRTNISQAGETSAAVKASIIPGSQLNSEQHNAKKTSGPKIAAFCVSFMFMTISFVGFLAYLPSCTLIVIETNNSSFWNNLPPTVFQVCVTTNLHIEFTY